MAFRHRTHGSEESEQVERKALGEFAACAGHASAKSKRLAKPCSEKPDPGVGSVRGWTREAVLSALRHLATELGRTPTASDLADAPSYCPSMDAVARVCGSLVRALRDAGLMAEASVKKKQRWTAKRCLEALRLVTAELRRAPTVGDVTRLRRAGTDLPSVTSLRRRFKPPRFHFVFGSGRSESNVEKRTSEKAGSHELVPSGFADPPQRVFNDQSRPDGFGRGEEPAPPSALVRFHVCYRTYRTAPRKPTSLPR